jgi:hypothetical protein
MKQIRLACLERIRLAVGADSVYLLRKTRLPVATDSARRRNGFGWLRGMIRLSVVEDPADPLGRWKMSYQGAQHNWRVKR